MKYNISIISFFDILGFKNIIKEAKSPLEVLNIQKIFRSNSKPDKELASLYDQKYVFFSDTIVRTTNILSKNNKRSQVGILFYELLDLIHIQLALFEKGILIRGSVVINEIYHRNPYIFGPGLNQAYKIENEKAIYPRIVVSKEIFDLVKASPLLKAKHHTFSEESEYVLGLVRKYRDNNFFLDYLSVAESEVNEPPYDYIKYLKIHKSKIQLALKKYSKIPGVLEKYEWLKNYHNNTVAQLKGKVLHKYGFSKKELFIKLPNQRLSPTASSNRS
jgi:hypothetical protein